MGVHSVKGFNHTLVNAEMLEHDHPLDILWHVFTDHVALGTKADDIWRLTLIDALDEPVQSVLVLCESPPPEDQGELPQARMGHTRSESISLVVALTPLDDEENGSSRATGDGQSGFGRKRMRVTRVLDIGLPWRMMQAVRWVPLWFLATTVEKRLEEEYEAFQGFIKTSTLLEHMLESGPRAGF